MRSGTENVAGIIGLATAADIAVNTLHYRMEKSGIYKIYGRADS